MKENTFQTSREKAKQVIVKKNEDRLSKEIDRMFKAHSYGKLWLYGDSK